jgi:hypothetical protein
LTVKGAVQLSVPHAGRPLPPQVPLPLPVHVPVEPVHVPSAPPVQLLPLATQAPFTQQPLLQMFPSQQGCVLPPQFAQFPVLRLHAWPDAVQKLPFVPPPVQQPFPFDPQLPNWHPPLLQLWLPPLRLPPPQRPLFATQPFAPGLQQPPLLQVLSSQHG